MTRIYENNKTVIIQKPFSVKSRGILSWNRRNKFIKSNTRIIEGEKIEVYCQSVSHGKPGKNMEFQFFFQAWKSHGN